MTNSATGRILRGQGDVCMILNDEEIQETMESPINLMNRLKSATTQTRHPSLPPTAEELIENLEDKLGESGSLKSKAASIMKSAMTELERRLVEVHKPERLASIVAEMSKVVHAAADKGESVKGAQVIIYAPVLRTEEQFDVITVNE